MTLKEPSKDADSKTPQALSWTFINIDEGDFALGVFEDQSYLIEEWSLRRFLNVPNVINDPVFKSFINEDLLELAKPRDFLTPEPYPQKTTGFDPRLLIELCELHLLAWEEELVPSHFQERVECCAILYWHLVGGGADQMSRAIFGDYEFEDDES
ncbi:MAG: hypothetical protein P1V97_09825 [Planctomycetota bacterium]|nr:hypothetical protein [Planctomycetota bacterium]